MKYRCRKLRTPGRVVAALLGVSLLSAATGFAQEEEGEASPAAEPAADTPAPAAEPTSAEVPAEEEPAPPPAEEPPPEASPEPVAEAAPEGTPLEDEAPGEGPSGEKAGFEPTFTVGVGMRTGLAMGLSGPTEGQLSLNDGLVDEINIRPFLAGSLTPNIGFFTQFEIGSGTPNGLGNFAILDAIAQIKIVDEFQVWVGQHIPANDRNNMNGPFFGNTWNFAIAVGGYPFDVGARDRGVTAWGLINDGMLKYHLSVVDLQPDQPIEKARYAGRLTLHLLEPENFYYNSGTYWGSQDVLAIGAVVHGQKGDDGMDNGLLGFSFDAMFEKNFGKGGTLTAEAGYWNFDNTGANYVGNQGTADASMGVWGPYPGESAMGVLSWLTPGKVGYGQIQPNVRLQYGDLGANKNTVFDLGLAYVVDGFNHKYHLNYRHAESEDKATMAKTTDDILQIGFQYQMAR